MHRLSIAGKVQCYVRLIDAKATRTLPSKCSMITVSPLLRALILRCADFPMDYKRGGVESRVAELSSPALFRRLCDGGGSTPVRRSRLLRCHYVRVGVVLGRQSSSEEMQNSVDCLTEKIHGVTHSCSAILRGADDRQLFSSQCEQAASGVMYPVAGSLPGVGQSRKSRDASRVANLCGNGSAPPGPPSGSS
jgi:hypothetical protein